MHQSKKTTQSTLRFSNKPSLKTNFTPIQHVNHIYYTDDEWPVAGDGIITLE